METKNKRKDKNIRRSARVSYKVNQNWDRPKLYVYRSNKHIYAQIVDSDGKTVVGVSSKNIESPENKKGKIDKSFNTGKAIAMKAKEKNISEVVFNRGSFKYHGRVKALADGARNGGLKF
jgi:large subunit ribosomal protein L18